MADLPTISNKIFNSLKGTGYLGRAGLDSIGIALSASIVTALALGLLALDGYVLYGRIMTGQVGWILTGVVITACLLVVDCYVIFGAGILSSISIILLTQDLKSSGKTDEAPFFPDYGSMYAKDYLTHRSNIF